MFDKVDTRLGYEFGLTGRYAELPAFKIVSEAHDALAALTTRLITLEYGGSGDLYVEEPRWRSIRQSKAGFARRLGCLEADVVRAANLVEDVSAFQKDVLEPFILACEVRAK